MRADEKWDWVFDLVLLPFVVYSTYVFVTTPRRRR